MFKKESRYYLLSSVDPIDEFNGHLFHKLKYNNDLTTLKIILC